MGEKQFYWPFSMTIEENSKVDEWIKKHDKKHKKDKVYLCAGMASKYYIKFTPTNLGTVGECICSTCEKKNKKKYKKLYWKGKKEKAEKKYGYSFTFRELE